MIVDFIKLIAKYKPIFKENKKYIVLLLILAGVTVGISILTPALTAKIISYMVQGKYTAIIIILFLLGIVQTLNLTSNILNSKVFFKFRKNFIFRLKKQLSISILNLDMNTLSDNRKGKFIQRINNDPSIVASCLADIKKYIILLFTNVGVIIYTVYLSPILGLIYLISSVLILYIRGIGVKKKKIIQNSYYNEQDKNTSLWSEIFNGIRDIKTANAKEQFENKTAKAFENIEDLQFKADFYFDLCVKATIVIEWVANALIVLMSAYLMSKGYIVLETFLVVFMYRKNIFSFSDCFTDMLDRMINFNLSSERIFEVIDIANIQSNGEESIEECDGNIEFKNVSFSYNDKSNLILDNCNLKIKTNESTAIIGRSGAGKTTILNLILKMYNVTQGEILLDGKNINEISEQYIRKNISIISQNYYLFDMSIKENLMLVKPDLTENEMQDVCQKVGLNEFILSLPDKYDTNIGEGGCFLSGGQRQRLVIARTLLLNTKIILFDEVTSYLDNESKQAVKQLIDTLKNNHTVVLVTHEDFLRENCDQKYYLKDGKVER